MNARHRLAALYEEWRLMTESEGDAIRTLAWPRVEHCQRAKRELQERILKVGEATDSGQESPEELHRQLRPVLEHLIELETRNNEWLAAARHHLEREQDELNRSRFNMRQVHSSYSGRIARTA